MHHTYMVKKKRPSGQRSKPKYGPHFLRKWRLKREMTLEAVAEAVGLSHAQLQRIETRQQKYSQTLLERLSGVYGVPVTWLIERDPDLEEVWKEIDRFRDFTLGQGNPLPA